MLASALSPNPRRREWQAAFRADEAATIASFRAQLVFRAVTMGRGVTGAFSDCGTASILTSL